MAAAFPGMGSVSGGQGAATICRGLWVAREISIALGLPFRVPGLTALGFEDLAAFAFCAQRVVTFRQDRYNLDLILSYVLVDSKTKEV